MDDWIIVHVTLFDNPALTVALLFLVVSAIVSIIRWILDILP